MAETKRKCVALYKGELAKKGRLHQLYLARELGNVGENQDWVRELDERIDFFKKRMLLLLLQHYEIPLDRPDKWMLLARSLAHDHVPAFSTEPASKRGRPRKPGNLEFGRYGLGQLPLRKQLGRPKEWTSERLQAIRNYHEKGAASLRKQGKRVTNVAAFVEYTRLSQRAGQLKGWKDAEVREVARYFADRFRKDQPRPGKTAATRPRKK